MEFGGLGGVPGGRPLDADDRFVRLLNEVFGERVRADDVFASTLWGALANVHWESDGGDTAGYSFRAAGDVVAAIRGGGDYLDWYCSAPSGVVPPEISAPMFERGWRWQAA